MTIRNLMGRLERALEALPACRGTREIVARSRDFGEPELPPYEFTAADRCPTCGVLGCGVLVVEEVVVTTHEEAAAMYARSGGQPA